jgi:plastocyanin
MRLRIRMRIVPTLVIGVVAVAVLAGCGAAAGMYGGGGGTRSTPASTGTTVGADGSVVIQGAAFTPRMLTVKPGTTVTWTNKDSFAHTVTSASDLSVNATPTGLFESGQFGQGRTFSFTFRKAGTYFYECTIHKSMASMHGEVVVK